MRMTSRGFVDRGYPVSEVTLYMYCDRCGSFSIQTHIALWKKCLIVAFPLAVFLAIRQIQPPAEWFLAALYLLPLALIMFPSIPWRDWLLGYRCRKCGNEAISYGNPRHYRFYDKNIVDVEERLVQKRYVDDDMLSMYGPPEE